MSTPRPPDAPSPFFLAFGRSLVSFRWVVLLVIVAITVGAGWLAAKRLNINNSLEVFAPKSQEMEALQDYRRAFGRDDVFLILIEGDVFSTAFLEKLDALHKAVSKVDVDVRFVSRPAKESAPASEKPAKSADLAEDFGDEFGDEAGDEAGDDGFDEPAADPAATSDTSDLFADVDDEFEGFADDDTSDEWAGEVGGSVMEDVVSLINARQTLPTEDGGIIVTKLLDPLPTTDELTDVKARALADPAIVGRLVGKAGNHTVIVARTFPMRDEDMERVYDELHKTLEPFQSDDFRILVSGQPAINAAMNQMVLGDMQTLVVVSVAAMLLVLALLFRHPIGIFGPIIVVGVSVVWTLGFMAVIGFGMTILSTILPSFLLCVGVGDSVHMVSIYRDLRRHGVDNRQAIIQAIGVTGPPIFFTSVTTMGGLLSLNFASVPAIAEMGVAGGVGVIFAFVLSITLLPIILTVNTRSLLGSRPAETTQRDWIDNILVWMEGLSDNRIKAGRLGKTLFVSGIFTLIAGIGMSQLGVWHDDLATVPDDREVKKAVKLMDEHVGGVSSANLVIEPTNGTMKDLELLRGVDAVAEEIKAWEHPERGKIVGHALSMVDVVKETRRALYGGDQAQYRLPDTQGELNDLLFLFENQGPDELQRLATLDLDTSHLTFQVTWGEATSYGPLIAAITASTAKHIGERAVVRGTGGVYLMFRIVSTLLDDLIRSFSTAFIFITFLMIFMLRDVKLGLIAMIPNLLPIAFVMGLMGLTGIPIDLNNLLIASIALGIAVDDTIHFLHHFQVSFRASGNCDHAIAMARHHAGRAMFSTSAILSVGFGIYIIAENAIIGRFGSLIGLTVVAALLIDLIILPATLRLIYRRQNGQSAEAPTT